MGWGTSRKERRLKVTQLAIGKQGQQGNNRPEKQLYIVTNLKLVLKMKKSFCS